MSYSATELAPIVNGRSLEFWCQNMVTKNILATVASFGFHSLPNGKKFLDALQIWENHLPNSIIEFKQNLQHLSDKFPEINCAIILFLNNEVLMGVVGEGAIAIKRENKQGWLMQKSGLITGKLKNNDRLLLLAGNWWKKLKAADLTSALIKPQISDGAEELILKVHQEDINTKASGLLANISINYSRQLKTPNQKNVLQIPANFLTKFKPLIKPKILLIGFLIIILAVAIIVGLIKNFNSQKQLKFSDKLNQIKHSVDEGINLIELNPIRARELLSQAVTDLKTATKDNHLQAEITEINTNLEKAIQGYERALNKFTITPEIFFDFNLVRQNARPVNWFNFEDNLWITDKVNHSIYLLNIAKKSAKILAGDSQLSLSVNAVGTSVENYVLTDAIYQIGESGALKEAIPKDEKWGNITSMYFYGGNLYLLDSKNSQIWKYIRTETGFSDIRNYLRSDTTVDLASSDKLAINGSVWVSGGAQMFKFTQGVKEMWQIQGLPENLGDKLSVFTSDNVKNIYILDKTQNRIIQTDKDGVYLSQYAWSKSLEITDFMVSETLGKILLLVDDKIYGIGIK